MTDVTERPFTGTAGAESRLFVLSLYALDRVDQAFHGVGFSNLTLAPAG
jgi:hypothetical protein